MRRGAIATVLACTLASTLLVAGCSDDEDEPHRPAGTESATEPPTYDAGLEPAAAVLALVPDAATVLTVTDYEQLRLQLGVPGLTSADPAPKRARFWRQVATATAALNDGLLRPSQARLERRYGFSQDDVLWEARFSVGDDEGWILKFRDDLDMGGVRRAVDDGVEPLAGARVAANERVVGIRVASDPAESWAADADLVELVGRPAAATYVERSCIPFDDAFGPGVREQLASGPAADLDKLDELGPYAVSFGSDLATARLGESRNDAFDRARIADALPETEPSFGTAFQRPVADPASGRIGYAIADPRIAAELTLERRLPFALCAD